MNSSDLHYEMGDAIKALLDGKVDFLMHCCNAQGIMGAGIARQIKEEFPSAFQRYAKYCETGRKGSWLLGNNVIECGVINAIAQLNMGVNERQVHYGALAKCIADLHENKVIRNAGMGMRPTRIAVPYGMGCGLAGGDWQVVKELLEAKPSFISIIVYKLED